MGLAIGRAVLTGKEVAVGFSGLLLGRRWQAFKGAESPMQYPRYFPPHGSLSTRLDSRALAADLLLTPWHRPRCPKCHWLHILYCCQSQISATYHAHAPFLWYFVPAVIHKRHRESSISLAIWVCKFVYLPGITLKKDQETWLPTCDSAWFGVICYSAKLSHPMHSFEAWLFYSGLISKFLVHDGDFADKR